ncbi:hypothetical protein KR51_00001760 [Rubidibacter lacunae KORDI 51-2]|uniref:TVP38/TMEM64 family membrane protein n=1 Tax=Rubidibacter lacunae KORDI 51-2 TaxID=582515 RepID=U5DF44_9CHRO|nr:TVP38/TMEM64 family protein [Rubidibacter lacunae]ERN43108.1 hypothetical protein KR51_00001760 [Rubidibacter lacunae KORDI 51-2]
MSADRFEPQRGHRRRSRRTWQRYLRNPPVLLGLALLAGFATICCGPLAFLLAPDFWQTYLQEPSGIAIASFVLAQAFLTVLNVPGTLLAIAGGVAFGLAWGTLWTSLGAMLGALAAFGLARYLLQDWALRQFGDRPLVQKFRHVTQRYPWRCVLLARLSPLSPFTLTNYLLGLTPISWGAYSLGTCAGILPGVMLYTWLGVTGRNALQGKGALPLAIAVGLLLMLALLPTAFQRRSN